MAEVETLEKSTTTDDERRNKEFIRKLANDYIHFKIYGPEQHTISDIENKAALDKLQKEREEALNNNNNNNTTGDVPFKKTAKLLRKVSVELEKNNAEFFDKVCNNLNLNERNPEQAFKLVSEEVLSKESLNWGRVVSLFTFGGKLAEWFWNTQQEDKIEEVEEWLAESLSGKEDWIEERGGWENFHTTFSDTERSKYSWLKPSLFACVGISLAAVFTMKSMS